MLAMFMLVLLLLSTSERAFADSKPFFETMSTMNGKTSIWVREYNPGQVGGCDAKCNEKECFSTDTWKVPDEGYYICTIKYTPHNESAFGGRGCDTKPTIALDRKSASVKCNARFDASDVIFCKRGGHAYPFFDRVVATSIPGKGPLPSWGGCDPVSGGGVGMPCNDIEQLYSCELDSMGNLVKYCQMFSCNGQAITNPYSPCKTIQACPPR